MSVGYRGEGPPTEAAPLSHFYCDELTGDIYQSTDGTVEGWKRIGIFNAGDGPPSYVPSQWAFYYDLTNEVFYIYKYTGSDLMSDWCIIALTPGGLT